MKTLNSNIKLNYKIWLETSDNEGILGDGKWILLKTINETGSIKNAVDKLGWSYRKTWNSLKQIEKLLGFNILEKSRGGADGGNTNLTPEGQKLVKAFDNFHSEFDKQIQIAFEKFWKDFES